jgi:hypothetical protein
MERLWSPAVATGGNRSQMAWARKPQNHAKTVAVSCQRLPRPQNGKEGVDGSNPSEGSARAPQVDALPFGLTCTIASVPRYGALYGAFRIKKSAHVAMQPGVTRPPFRARVTHKFGSDA